MGINDSVQSATNKITLLMWYKDPSKFFNDIYGLKPYDYQTNVLKELSDLKNRRVMIMSSGGCIVKGEKVLMFDGTLKNIEDIKIGDKVVSNKDRKCVVKNVIGTQYSGIKQSYILKLSNGATLKCSYDHPILNNKNNWQEAQTFISYDSVISQYEYDILDYPISDERISLLAWLIAKGYYGIDQTPKITNTSHLQLSRLSSYLLKEFGFGGHLRHKTHTSNQLKDINGLDLLLTNGDKYHSSMVIQWLKELSLYGQTKENKQIPEIVFKFSNRQIQLFLKEFWFGDGTLDQNCRLIWHAGLSKHIADGIITLLHRLNRYPTLYKDNNSYEVRLYYNDINTLSNNKVSNEWCYILKDIGPQPVYDIQVEDTHNFIINSFVVHNSGKTKLVACHALWLAVPLAYHLKRPISIVIISGSEEQAKNLYNYIRDSILGNPLLKSLVIGDILTTGVAIKTPNGYSEIKTVPNSHRQIQGLHKDVVIIDEPTLAGDFAILDATRIVIKTNSLDRIVLLGTPFVPPDAKKKSELYIQMWEDTQKYPEGIPWKRFHWCYDAETECLTTKGWKLIKDLEMTDEIGIYKDGKLKFENPINLYKSNYKGKMISIEGRHINLLVTPNHKMITFSSKYNKIIDDAYKFKKFNNRTRRFIKTVEWDGKQPEHTIKIGNNKYNISDWLEFMGWYLSEGCSNIYTYNGYTSYKIGISNLEYKDEIDNLLTRMNIKYYYNGKHNFQFTFKNKELCKYLMQFGYSHDKYIPYDIKQLSSEYLKIIWNSLMKGDGSLGKDGFTNNRMVFYTTSKQLADDMMEISLKIGFNANMSVYNPMEGTKYVIYISNRKYGRYNKVKEVDYDGIIACPTTSSGFLLVRRNGKQTISGNSAMDCPTVTPQQLEEAKKNLPEDMFNVFWLGKPYFAGISMIPFEHLKRASMDVHTSYNPNYPVYGGLDYGWKAETVLTLVQYIDNVYHVVLSEGWRREEYQTLVNRIAELYKQYKIEVLFADSEDIGDNQRLLNLGLNVIPVIFRNDKVKMQAKLKAMFHQDRIRIDENMMKLKDQLRKYDWTTHEHDDRVDSLMLAMHKDEDEEVNVYWKMLTPNKPTELAYDERKLML